MHRVLSYAVRKPRLSKNPLSKRNPPEGWSQQPRPEDAIDLGQLAAPARALCVSSYCATASVWPRRVKSIACEDTRHPEQDDRRAATPRDRIGCQPLLLGVRLA